VDLDVGGRTVRLTRPEKVLYPSTGFTKRDAAAYYVAIAPWLLPHLAGRAVTLARFPDGVEGAWWFQANCPAGRPPWIPVATLAGRRGQVLRYCRFEDAAALAWAAGQGALELHPFLAHADAPERPLELVLDLDPAPPAGLLDACAVALVVRPRLVALGLEPVVKTSGWAGLHVVVHLDGTQTFRETQVFARGLGEALAAEAPNRVATRLPRAGREGRVLVDWRQNAAGLSIAAPYSLRAARVPRVSTPIRWDELEAALAAGDEAALAFGPAEAVARATARGDPFAPSGRARLPPIALTPAGTAADPPPPG
jgi:bifunctional non-homologous end joining protein LigD